MEFRGVVSSTKSYKIALVVAVALLLLLSSISYRQIKNLQQSADLVSQSLRIDKEINNLFSNYSLIEAAEFQAIITKDSTFFDTFKNYRRQSESSLNQLLELTKEYPQYQQSLDSITKLKDSLYTVIYATNRKLTGEEETTEANLMRDVNLTSALIKKLKGYRTEMILKKEALRKEHIITYKTETIFTPFISMLLVLFSLIVFGIAFRKIYNDRKKMIMTQMFINNIIGNSNNVISYMVPIRDKDKTIVDFTIEYISDKVEAHFGLKAEDLLGQRVSVALPMLIENEVFKSYVACIEHGEPQNYQRSYQVGSRLRWFNSITSKLDDGIIITTIDVTDQVNNERVLTDMNIQLKQTNEELESFNRIASHDLQEPLRKIQMFASRIADEHEKTPMLSEKGEHFFSKIQDGASRMQSLIINLLAYSRIDASHDDFEPVDLNLIIQSVKDNLAETIEEHRVKIQCKQLPTVNGVDFQLEQLFNNLISNAIKYKKDEGEARIEIASSIVHRDEINTEGFKLYKRYHEITVKDNGIGFDQENAEKIFEIFKRLHGRNTYSGTGIGLAICKKIVDNHRGFIRAVSTADVGSTFIVYVPA